jgi:hypothetical protein
VIAFSTRNRVPYDPSGPVRRVDELENDHVDPLFSRGQERRGGGLQLSDARDDGDRRGGRTVEAIPIDRLRELLRERKTSRLERISSG